MCLYKQGEGQVFSQGQVRRILGTTSGSSQGELPPQRLCVCACSSLIPEKKEKFRLLMCHVLVAPMAHTHTHTHTGIAMVQAKTSNSTPHTNANNRGGMLLPTAPPRPRLPPPWYPQPNRPWQTENTEKRRKMLCPSGCIFCIHLETLSVFILRYLLCGGAFAREMQTIAASSYM